MDSNNTTDDSGWKLMHQINEKIPIGKNTKFTQHDPNFENANDEEHLESLHRPILAVNSVKNDCICQSENVIEGRSRSMCRYSFPQLDRNCQKQ